MVEVERHGGGGGGMDQALVDVAEWHRGGFVSHGGRVLTCRSGGEKERWWWKGTGVG